jgi:hypothetical protein
MSSGGQKFDRQIAEVRARFSVIEIEERFSVFSNTDASSVWMIPVGQEFYRQIA